MTNELFERELRNTSINDVSLADYIKENYIVKKTGHWIDKDFRKEEYVLAGKCSVCGRVRVIDEFCSNCGARMESEE